LAHRLLTGIPKGTTDLLPFLKDGAK